MGNPVKPRLVLLALPFLLAACGGKPEPEAPPPPEVGVIEARA